MYAIDVSGYVSELYQVDIATGALTPIGELRDAGGNPAIAFGSSLAFDTSGVLWGLDGATARIGSINTATAEVALLPAPSSIPGFMSGITFDPATNVLYAVCEGGAAPGFYSVNTTTGAYTLLAANALTLSSISFGGNGVLYGVDYYANQLYQIDHSAGFAATAIGAPGSLHSIRELTAFGDGPGISLFAESDGLGLATIQVGPPNTSTVIGGLSGYGQIDGLAYSVITSNVVPEPSTLLLSTSLGAMVLAIGWRRRRRAA
jgi:hypothetical protein